MIGRYPRPLGRRRLRRPEADEEEAGDLPSFLDATSLIVGGWSPTIGGTAIASLPAASDLVSGGLAAYTVVALIGTGAENRVRLAIDPDGESIQAFNVQSGVALDAPCGQINSELNPTMPATRTMMALTDDGVSVVGRIAASAAVVAIPASYPIMAGFYEQRDTTGSVVVIVWPRALTIAELDALYAATTFPA